MKNLCKPMSRKKEVNDGIIALSAPEIIDPFVPPCCDSRFRAEMETIFDSET